MYNLKNKTVTWVKKKLEDMADYIQNYSYRNKKFPEGFEGNLLIQLYSDVVDLCLRNPDSKISEEQYDTYKKLAQIIRHSDSK